MRFLVHRRAQRGAALYLALFAALIFSGLTVAMVMVGLANKREREAVIARTQRRYLADAGISLALVDLTAGGSGVIASEGSPDPFGSGQLYVTVTDNGDRTFTIDATGIVSGDSRRLRCIARDTTEGVFQHAMFAGNEDGDPTYSLDLGGTGGQADLITGDIFSGGDIALSGDASATGALRAGGTITGATGEEGASQPLPDIAAMNYEVNHDVDVALEFATGSPTYTSNALGGDAWQLPEANPAHIFRLNPSDRSSEYLSTTKDDYFLEDPYEPVLTPNSLDPALVTRLSFSGVEGEPGVNSNDSVFYIDGNLWLHNRPFYSLAFPQTSGGVRVTFVVKGNVYFSDNMLVDDHALDGMAFIAIEDAAVPDSGNIYFGDPTGGTLAQMDAFMYAQNNFYDTNLDDSGSANIVVNGIMSAGNHVAIDRDHDGGAHTQLVLNFDSRISDGTLTLPGLPESGGTASTVRAMQVISVYEVDAP